METSQPSRDDGPSTQQLDPAATVPTETSQPQDVQEPILMETSQSGSQTTGPNEVPQEAVDPSPDGPPPVFPTGSIEGRITPEVPPPRDPESDDGWAQIDRVGGWRAVISPFGAMDQVPAQNKAVWAWAWGEVVQRIQSADSGLDLDRALMWLLFLPQGLCRKPRRGGIQGRGFVNKRFIALAEGNWGELVNLWESDLEVELSKQQRRRDPQTPDPLREEARKTMEVVGLLAKGQIHRAVDRINSFGVADLGDPSVMDQMVQKHPPRWEGLKDRVKLGNPIDNLNGLRDSLLDLKKGGSPGSGGLRAEYLITLAETLDDDKMSALESFGLRYLRGDLPPWFYTVFLASQSVALYKDSGKEAVRPIGVKHSLVRTFHREVVKQNRGEFVSYLEPEQLALSKGGGRSWSTVSGPSWRKTPTLWL